MTIDDVIEGLYADKKGDLYVNFLSDMFPGLTDKEIRERISKCKTITNSLKLFKECVIRNLNIKLKSKVILKLESEPEEQKTSKPEPEEGKKTMVEPEKSRKPKSKFDK
jgi:hypothetical protein